jgi:hypothetical protein
LPTQYIHFCTWLGFGDVRMRIGNCCSFAFNNLSLSHNTGSSKKMDGFWNRYNLKSTGRIYTFGVLKCSDKFKVFMQDGAPPHFSCFVTDVLNERFPDAWIGRGGPIPWPPRSPDLSTLDFFLWGYIKNIVYAEKIRNIQHQPLKL